VSSVVSNGVAVFLIWLFAGAALHKVRAPQYYQRLISSWLAIIPDSRVLLWLVVLAEFGVVALLLLPGARPVGFGGAGALLLVYAAVMGWQYKMGQGEQTCGCAGPSSPLRVGPVLVARNLLCAGLAMLSPTLGCSLPENLVTAALALLAGVTLVSLYSLSDQMLASAQAMDEDI